MKERLLPWLLAARPKTLPAAIVPVWVGSYPAMQEDRFSWPLFWATLLSCVCIQIATNLFNDAIDSHKGADTSRRLGPRRVTASGMLSPKTVIFGALGFCLAACVIAVPMIEARGWPVMVAGIISLYFAYGYTGGPYPLAYRGLGEIFVVIFFGFVAVIGSWFVQTGEGPGELQWVSGFVFGLLSCVLIAINNLRDIDEDRSTGKRTLAVRFGQTFAKWEIATFCLVPWALFMALAEGLHDLWGIPLFIISSLILIGIRRFPPGPIYNQFLALSALQLILHAVAFTFAI